MSLTTELFRALRDFDDTRRGNRDIFLRYKEARKQYRGSEGYNRDMKEAEEKRRRDDETARKEAVNTINSILRKMQENAGKRPLTPPTSEQLAILQVLSMRDTVSKAELDRASVNMAGNALALSALNGIAEKHFPMGHTNYASMASELDTKRIDNLLRAVSARAGEILKSPVKKSALTGARAQHGMVFDEDTLPQREPLTTERDFYRDAVPDEVYAEFESVVNGNE